MKKRFYIPVLIVAILIYSCSTDEPTIEVPKTETATIDSYSKNFGYSDEPISIYGNNLSTNIEDISIKFDNIEATIVSASLNEIVVKLPVVTNSIPELSITIAYRIITNNVENEYYGNIGILASSIDEWHIIDSSLPVGYIYKSQSIGKEKLYFSTNDQAGYGVYRTKDGGITWSNWGRSGFDGSFYATSNDEGWTQTTFGVNKVPIGGSTSLNSDIHPSTSTIGLYINDNLTSGFLISYQKIVYKTTDGTSFIEVYNNDPSGIEDPKGNSSQVRVFSELDENNIWAGGYLEVDQNLDYTPVNKFYAPLVLFLDNGIWAERSIPGLASSSQAKQIQFINEDKGYLYVKNKGSVSPTLNQLFKSIDGGNSWELLYDAINSPITSFSFKNETLGWFCSGNKIYKTIDGGMNWTIDYTHDSDIGNITYNDGIVWAVTSNNILKLFTE